MTDSDTDVMLDALNAFGDQQYGQCLVTIGRMSPVRDPVFIQLYIICMQRLGLTDEVQAFTDRVLPRLAGHPEVDGLVRLALGLAEPDAIAGSVDDAELHFCLGSRLLTLGDVAAARDHLSRCAEKPEESLERLLARVQLEWPSQEPPPGDPRQAAYRANARSVKLSRAHSADAPEATAEAYWLARRVMPFGELRLGTALNYAHLLWDAGQLSAAEDRCREVLFLYRHCSSDVDSDLVVTLVLLGRVFVAQQRYAEADDVLHDALERQQAISGEASTECAIVLEQLVTAAEASGDQERTIAARLRYFDVAVDVDGPHAVHATAKVLVESLRAAGRDPEAERVCRTWLDRSDAADPTWLPGVAAALSRLADILDDHRRYEESAPCYDRLVSILESTGSADEVAARKSFTFSCLHAGDPARADEISERLPELARQHGMGGDALAEVLTCRVVCLQELGRHTDSIRLLTEALPLAEAEGAVVVRRLLSNAYAALEDPVAGLANQRALVDLLRDGDGDGKDNNAELMARALQRLAVMLLELRKLHEANDVLAEADRTIEGNPDLPPDLTVGIHNAHGAAAIQADDYASALAHLTAADKIMRSVDTGLNPLPILANLLRSRHNLGPGAADADLVDRIAKLAETATGLSRVEALLLLGEDAHRRGDAPGAIGLLRASLAANTGSSRGHQQARASCHFSLATALAATGDFAAAFEAVRIGEQFHEVTLLEAGTSASEQERLRIVVQNRRDMGLLFTLAAHRRADPVATRAAWQALLRSKGIAYEAMAIHWPRGNGKSDELAAARSELAAFDLRGFPVIGESEDGFAVFHAYLETRNTLRQRIARLEEALGGDPKCRARLESVLRTDADEVIAALPARTALIEFVRYDVAAFDVAELLRRTEQVRAYGAFLVTADGPPRFFPLGDATEVEAALSHPDRAAGVLADVLAAIPRGIDRLLFVPDGGFAKVSMADLPTPGGGMLIDHLIISYLDAARDILDAGPAQAAPTSAVVVSDPAFDLADSAPPEDGQAPVPWVFAPLPGTLLEGRAVERMLDALHWTGTEATKARLLQLHAPIVLHLATHGFFLDDDTATEWEVDHGGPPIGVAPEDLVSGRLTGLRLSNPFLRSGLALAGANDWLRTGRLRQPWGDGLLTAHDMAGLDLRGTQLVVFSACETGLGAIRTGDGVLGLRRAARLAGARAQIMALTRIPDLASAVLVIRLYEILREDDVCGDVALRLAQLYVRDVTVQELRDRFLGSAFVDLIPSPVHTWLAASKPSLRPFRDARNWASFVYVGPPTRLEISMQRSVA